MSDTSRRDEREICWCQHEHLWGHSAGSRANRATPGRALLGSQTPIERGGLVPGAWREGETHATPLWVQPRYHQPMGACLPWEGLAGLEPGAVLPELSLNSPFRKGGVVRYLLTQYTPLTIQRGPMYYRYNNRIETNLLFHQEWRRDRPHEARQPVGSLARTDTVPSPSSSKSLRDESGGCEKLLSSEEFFFALKTVGPIAAERPELRKR